MSARAFDARHPFVESIVSRLRGVLPDQGLSSTSVLELDLALQALPDAQVADALWHTVLFRAFFSLRGPQGQIVGDQLKALVGRHARRAPAATRAAIERALSGETKKRSSSARSRRRP